MAVLPILHHPDPRLRIRARPVTEFGDKLKSLVEDLFETMYDAPGVGLAATQVGVDLRVAVIDCSREKEQPERIVMVNPEIVGMDDEQEMEEGCLSVPEVSDKVQRCNRVKLRAQDADGKAYELEATGLLAQAVQHEIDHLDGRLYIDYLSSLKRERITKKLSKQARRNAA